MLTKGMKSKLQRKDKNNDVNKSIDKANIQNVFQI